MVIKASDGSWRELSVAEFCVLAPYRHGEYKEIFSEYSCMIALDLCQLSMSDIHGMKDWCNDIFGKAEGWDPGSSWQIGHDQLLGPRHVLLFMFKDEEQLVAFKVKYGEYVY